MIVLLAIKCHASTKKKIQQNNFKHQFCSGRFVEPAEYIFSNIQPCWNFRHCMYVPHCTACPRHTEVSDANEFQLINRPLISSLSTNKHMFSTECIGSILQGEDNEPWSSFLHQNVTPIFTLRKRTGNWWCFKSACKWMCVRSEKRIRIVSEREGVVVYLRCCLPSYGQISTSVWIKIP